MRMDAYHYSQTSRTHVNNQHHRNQVSFMSRRLVMMQGAQIRAKIATQPGSQTSAGTRSAPRSDDEAYTEMFRRRVMSLRHQGRFSRCLEANEQVLEQFPTSVAALCLKSEVLLTTRKAEDALKAADRATESGETLQNAVKKGRRLKACRTHEIAVDLCSTRWGFLPMVFRCSD